MHRAQFAQKMRKRVGSFRKIKFMGCSKKVLKLEFYALSQKLKFERPFNY